MQTITICILCRNRPEYARQAILSILEQTYKNFELLVSDNSSNDEVQNMMKREFPEVCYIRRAPPQELWEHINRCIEELRSEYFCLFHDDDVMKPEFVETVETYLRAYPAAIAFGCNAEVETCGKKEARNFFRSFRKQEVLTMPREMAERYFSRAQSGFPPFPGYVYNRSMIGDQRLPYDGGKYADVTWLLNLIRKGNIVWITKPLMIYRYHENNYGKTESVQDRLKFLAYLKSNRAEFGEGILKDYRYSFVYKKLLKTCENRSLIRCRTAASFKNYYRWNRYLRLDYYKALIVRALVKLVAE